VDVSRAYELQLSKFATIATRKAPLRELVAVARSTQAYMKRLDGSTAKHSVNLSNEGILILLAIR
jgi:hypothetical protein